MNTDIFNGGGINLNGDVEAMLNIRDWLKTALEKARAKVVDSGLGFGAADIGIRLDGCDFSVSIAPRVKL